MTTRGKILTGAAILFALAQVAAAQTRDTTQYIGLFQPRGIINAPSDYVPLVSGAGLGLPGLYVNKLSFPFDTTATKSNNLFQSNLGVVTGDPCFTEMRSTAVNKGMTTANCHVIYTPTLSGTFGSNNSLQINATFSGVRNSTGQLSPKVNVAGIMETCRVMFTGGNCWGSNPLVTDTTGVNGILIGTEADIIPQGALGGYTGNMANPTGFRSVMVGVQGSNLGTAFMAQKYITSTTVWNAGFFSADSGASIAVEMGSLGTQASQNSQPLVGCYRDGGATSHCINILDVDFVGNTNLCRGCGGVGSSTNVNNSEMIILSGGVQTAAVALTCGATTSIAIEVRSGGYFTCNITSNVAATLQVPAANPSVGRSKTIGVAFRNSSGGALTTAPTFTGAAGGYKFSGSCNPANGTQCVWMFTFDQLQGFWYQVGGTPTGL